MPGFIEKLARSGMSRREFVAASAAATASIGLFGLSGCTSKPKENEVIEYPDIERKPVTGGEWRIFACNYDCGQRCLLKAYIVDGVATRLKTDDTTDDHLDRLQARSCIRGRSLLNYTYAPDKLRYPLKRKNWSPEKPNGHLRGIDEWERISWDDAIKIVCSEITKAREKYGPFALYSPQYNSDQPISNVLHYTGGFLTAWYTSSGGSWRNSDTFGYGYSDSINDRFSYDGTVDYFIMFGHNPSWSSAGNPTYFYTKYMKEKGTKFFSVDPYYSDSAAQFDAEWFPIRLGTDSALYLAMAYVLFTEDDPEKNPLIDWEFVRKYSVGMDEKSQYPGADPKHNYRAYVLGEIGDCIPKTPEWASEICGIAPEDIRRLALICDKKNNVVMQSGQAHVRQSETSSTPVQQVALGILGGHIGRVGRTTAASTNRSNLNGGRVYRNGSTGNPELGKDFPQPFDVTVNCTDHWDAIITGKTMTSIGRGTAANIDADVNIRAIINFRGNCLETQPRSELGVEAFRKVDFVVTVHQQSGTNCKYSDIILPETTKAEDYDEVNDKGVYSIHIFQRAIEPLYEAKSARDIGELLLEGFGKPKEELFPVSEKQGFFNELAGTTVLDTDGKTMVKLTTITQEDIDKWGVKGKPQEGKIGIDELIEKGRYVPDLTNFRFIAYENFIKDPEKNKLKTPSGKWEIYSLAYQKQINGLRYSTIDPLPMYRTGTHRYEATFSDWGKKVKGPYPFQMYSIHYPGAAHTFFTESTYIQEAWQFPVAINSKDAKDNGISEGDTVLIEAIGGGKMLRHAHITECIALGQLWVPYGKVKEIDEETGIDTSGAVSTTDDCPPTGFGVAAFNSMQVRISKYSGSPMPLDVDKPRRVFYKD